MAKRMKRQIADEYGEPYAKLAILLNEARGWAKGLGQGDTGRVLTHTGSNTMWFAVVWLAPEKDWAVLVCCNKGGGEAAKACDEAVAAMIRKYVAGAK